MKSQSMPVASTKQSRGPITYATAVEFLGGAQLRKLGPGTTIMRGSEGRVHVVHDRSAIITFHSDLTISLHLPDDTVPVAAFRDRVARFLLARGGRLRTPGDDIASWMVVAGPDRAELPLIDGISFVE